MPLHIFAQTFYCDFFLPFHSAEISDDSSLIAIGFADSVIKVWSLTPSKLREMKPAEQLKDIDRDAGIYADKAFQKHFLILFFLSSRRCIGTNDGRSYSRNMSNIFGS